MNGERTEKPDTHVCHWQGEMPCHSNGQPIRAIENASPRRDLGHGLTQVLTFSAKADYRDYHHKMTTYLGRITGEAPKVDPAVTAQTFPVIPVEDETESVFKYLDTASNRAGIGALNERFASQRMAIVGLGGTGAYILDLVAAKRGQVHLDSEVNLTPIATRSPDRTPTGWAPTSRGHARTEGCAGHRTFGSRTGSPDRPHPCTRLASSREGACLRASGPKCRTRCERLRKR